jgi:hypothetical protein
VVILIMSGFEMASWRPQSFWKAKLRERNTAADILRRFAPEAQHDELARCERDQYWLN